MASFKALFSLYDSTYYSILYQYYGLLRYNEGISALPNDIKGYNKSKVRKKLYSYREKLNFYLMNSVFIKVSHITHHNSFFEYLKDSFGIKVMTDLMLEKVTVMNDLVNQWQQKRKSKKLIIISIIGGIFAFIQTYNNVLGIYDYSNINDIMNRHVFSLIAPLLATLVGLIIWLIFRNWTTE